MPATPEGSPSQAAREKLGADVPGERLAGRDEALPGCTQLVRAGASEQQFLLDQVPQEEAAVLQKRMLQHAVRNQMDQLILQGRYRDAWPDRVEPGVARASIRAAGSSAV